VEHLPLDVVAAVGPGHEVDVALLEGATGRLVNPSVV